jgi:hypothetical protein
MVVKIGTISADLTANSASFTKNINKAEKSLKSSSTKMNRFLGNVNRGFARTKGAVSGLAGSLLNLPAGVGVAAGAAGLGLLIKSSIEAADAIAKTSDSIGISTSKLQEYRFAASQSGVSTEAFDKAMQGFAKRVGEAQAGTGSLITVLKKVDPSLLANIQNAKSTDEAYRLMTEAIANTEDATLKAALANAAFGRTGVEMVNLMNQGVAGLDSFSAKARELGLVIDESLLRNSEKANDQLDILSRVLSTKVTAAVVELAPEISKLTQSFIDFIPKVTEALKWVNALGTGLGNFFGAARDGFTTMGIVASEALGVISDDVAADALLEMENRAKGIANEFERAKTNAEAVTGSLPAPASSGGGLDLEGIKKQQELMQRGESIAQSVRTPLETYQDNISELNELQAQGAITQDIYNRAVEQAGLALDMQAEKQQKVAATGNDLKGVIESVSNQAINGQISSWKDLGNVAVDVLQNIIQQQLNAQSVLGGSGGGGLGGLLSAGLSAAGSFFGFGGFGGASGTSVMSTTGIPGFARGGSFTVGGRQGTDNVPVSFMASAGERVTVETPAQQRSGGGGGSSVVYNIDARGAEAGVEHRIMDALKRVDSSIEGRAVKAVQNKNLRSPSFLRA